jgi:hypothetical protein
MGKACWCSHVAELFPSDTRSVRCSDKLHAIAALVQALPDTHPLFARLEQIQRKDGIVRERWLDELQLEFSYLGYLFAEEPQRAIQRLIEVTDASLRECEQTNGLP